MKSSEGKMSRGIEENRSCLMACSAGRLKTKCKARSLCSDINHRYAHHTFIYLTRTFNKALLGSEIKGAIFKNWQTLEFTFQTKARQSQC